MNLLYFVFEIFDDNTPLPQEIVNRTPLPHEDGRPRFRHSLDPGFRLRMGGKALRTGGPDS